MAELPPNLPSGAVPPPPKKETGKVQPKKETVRINLPPKPSAAPTIKLPTLPPGGPTGAPSAAPAPAAVASAPRASLAAPAAPKPVASAAPAPQTRIAAAPLPPPVPTLKTLDKAFVYTAVVFSLAAVGIVVWIYLTLQSTVQNFVS